MPDIQVQDGEFEIDAEIIAQGLGLEARCVPALMRDGEISSRSEQGQGEDAGRYRLTFFHGDDRFQLIVDQGGRILGNSARGS